jgi:hypothetical protein
MEQINELKKLKQKQEEVRNKEIKLNKIINCLKSNDVSIVYIHPYGVVCCLCDYNLENNIDYKKLKPDDDIKVTVCKCEDEIICQECYHEVLNKIEETIN